MWPRVRIRGRTFFYFKFLVSIGKHLRDHESRSKRGPVFLGMAAVVAAAAMVERSVATAQPELLKEAVAFSQVASSIPHDGALPPSDKLNDK